MRLVIDGRRLTQERTGVGRVLESLLQEWAVSGLPFDPAVIVLKERAGLKRVPKIAGLASVQLGERWPGLVWERFGLGSVLQSGDFLFAPANLVPWHWRGPTVLTIFDLVQEVLPESFPWHVRWRFGWRYRLAAQRASVIVAPSQSTASDIERIYRVRPERVRVVPLAPDPFFCPIDAECHAARAARRAIGLSAEPFFLFVGKRTRRRNLPSILRAMEAHRLSHPEHWLVLVGPEPSASDGIVSDAQRGIVVAGHVTEDVLRGLLASALALLFPSNYEGFGLPVVEAMASGCPVITLHNSALAEVGGDAPWYCPSAEPFELASAMHRLATDPAERAERIRLGLRQAQRFSRKQFAAQMTTTIREAAAPTARPTRAVAPAEVGAVSQIP